MSAQHSSSPTSPPIPLRKEEQPSGGLFLRECLFSDFATLVTPILTLTTRIKDKELQ